MKKFIYVFDEDDKSAMLDLGYKLLTDDEVNGMFVFVNQESGEYASGGTCLPVRQYVLSDMLIFNSAI